MTRTVALRHAHRAALAAVTIDASYTTWYWLIKGRPHPARRYFLILGQLSLEVALIWHLITELKNGEESVS